MAIEYEVTAGKRIIGWITTGFAKLGLGNFVVLTTTGRRSGRPRSVPVAPISDVEGEYLVSPYGESGWVLNVRADPKAHIRRGKTENGVRLIEVTGEKPELVRAYYEREAFARRFMDVPGAATVSDFASVPERFPVFAIQSQP